MKIDVFMILENAVLLNPLYLTMSLLFVIWIVVLFKFSTIKSSDKSNLILPAALLLLTLSSTNVGLLLTIASVVVITNFQVIEAVMTNNRTAQVSMFLIVLGCLAGLFNLQDENVNWKLGLDSKYESIYELTQEIDIPFFRL